MASNDWMVVNNVLKSKWKEIVVALSRHYLVVFEETDRVVSVRIGNRTGHLSHISQSALC
jgi:hypothetical protein